MYCRHPGGFTCFDSCSCIVDTLEDLHVLNISQRVTSEQELRNLGTKALKVPEHIIDTALYDNRTSIQDAAHDVLSTWRKQYQSSQGAYLDLLAGLKRAKINQLVTQLRKWVQGTEDVSQISDESKLLEKYTCKIIVHYNRFFK